jgi:hypothetical protein
LDPTGVSHPGKTPGLTGTGTGLANQEVLGRVFGQVWNGTELFFLSKLGLLVGYQDPLLTLSNSMKSLILVSGCLLSQLFWGPMDSDFAYDWELTGVARSALKGSTMQTAGLFSRH